MRVAGEILLELFCGMPGLFAGVEVSTGRFDEGQTRSQMGWNSVSDVWSLFEKFVAQVEPHQPRSRARG